MDEPKEVAEETVVEEKFRLRTVVSDEDGLFLRKKSEEVAFAVVGSEGSVCVDRDTAELIEALKTYTRENEALGMSAVQLGVLKRVFVMRKPWNSENLITVINPSILRVEGKSTKIEACFSIPMPDGMGAGVQRPSTIWVSFSNEAGEIEEDMFVGMDARVFQHEFDHLRGRLMLDEPNFKGWRRQF